MTRGTQQALRFEAVWTEHSAAVLRYAARRVPASDVDDVVAETFVVVWRRIDEVPEPALPWLLGVARGVAANAIRSANRRQALRARLAVTEPTGAAIASPDPTASDAAAVDAERIDVVGNGSMARALAALSPADRELLTLIAWDGLSPTEAATAVGCSRATLAVRLHRARGRLRAQLDLAGAAAGSAASRTTTSTSTTTTTTTPTIFRTSVPLPGVRGEESR